MQDILKSAALAVLLCAPAGTALAASAAFDFTFREGVSDDIVGTGSMVFDDPGDGAGKLVDLQNVTASFVFGDVSLTWDDWDNDPDSSYEILTNLGVRSLLLSAFFGDTISTGLDMTFGLSFLFNQRSFGGPEFRSFDGGYLASAASDSGPSVIPLPATLPLLVAGLGALALMRRRVGAD